MAEKLCSLKKIGGGGGSLTETVLWTNPNPSSAFGAQAVTLSDSLSNYDYIGIDNYYDTAYADTSATPLMSVEDFKKCIYSTSTTIPRMALTLGGERSSKWFRYVNYVSDTSIQFSIGRTTSTTTSGNACIPTRVIGIKVS